LVFLKHKPDLNLVSLLTFFLGVIPLGRFCGVIWRHSGVAEQAHTQHSFTHTDTSQWSC